MDGASPVVNQQSSAESKIHLFRSFFRDQKGHECDLVIESFCTTRA